MGCHLQIQSTPPPPQGLEFGSFPSCQCPASFARLGDEITISVPLMQKGLLFWLATRQTTYCPRLPGEQKHGTPCKVQPIPEPDPDSPSFVCGFLFSVLHLSLDKRDEGGFLRFDFSVGSVCFGSHLQPMLTETRAQNEGLRTALDELFGGLISVHLVRTGL